MAQKRMFDKTIIDSDNFLDMQLSTQALYFHLNMRADDEGFINNPKRIMRMIGSNDDDLKLLILKKFVINFDSGVIVIKHWKMNNYLNQNRIKETIHLEEKEQLGLTKNNEYDFLGLANVKPLSSKCLDSIEENSIEENSIEENKVEEYSREENKHRKEKDSLKGKENLQKTDSLNDFLFDNETGELIEDEYNF